MHTALTLFESNIAQARELSGLYDFLCKTLNSPLRFDDLLRSQIVYSVSAFDKYIHDLIRKGMTDTFSGLRSATARFKNEPITLETHMNLTAATIPPKEHIFDQEVVKKLRALSFQDPEKVADGLSLITDKNHKWSEISAVMGIDAGVARKRLKLIAQRRNSIVHEADIDPFLGHKVPIIKEESEGISVFLLNCGRAIYDVVS
ncbi:MAG: HEPN domain-containing protein [Pseudomonadota bacterium]